ncbi:hypothetical protein [Microbispora bryophytorum]|uniref:hypothetical protein n=1 Tax=Microbispora bryophytorum TaxID=1460882 RepID=UPI00371B2721
MMDLSALEGLCLTAVTAALFIHESDAPELLHVWLHLETTTVVVRDTTDWALHIVPDEPGDGYTMEELGSRVDIVPAPAEVPFVRHVGERLVQVSRGFDPRGSRPVGGGGVRLRDRTRDRESLRGRPAPISRLLVTTVTSPGRGYGAAGG